MRSIGQNDSSYTKKDFCIDGIETIADFRCCYWKIDVRNIDIPQYEHITEIDSEYEEFEDEEDNVTGGEE